MAASEHLHYEIWMFTTTAKGLASGIAGKGALNNALLESFTLHARALLAFLYDKNSREDDVVADDFFSGWEGQCPRKPAALDDVHFRVNKEIAHLTYHRLSVTEEAKKWNFEEVASEMRRVLAAFVRLASEQNFGPNMKQWKADFLRGVE